MNVHTSDGRYAPFARLLEMDGLQVNGSSSAITASLLAACEIYVTANPMGMKGTMQQLANLLRLDRSVHFDVDAFSDAEIQSLVAWVQSGGRALIVADHAPAGLAARRLAAAFGVEMTTWWAEEEGSGTVTFSRSAGTIRPHPIADGRRPEERLETVMTFTGQALRPPREDQIVLGFSPRAREYPFRRSREAEGRPAAGLAQAVAVPFGSGRVVVLGEAAAITAQLIGNVPSITSVGMNRTDIDNQQFALNIVRWLMGVLN